MSIRDVPGRRPLVEPRDDRRGARAARPGPPGHVRLRPQRRADRAARRPVGHRGRGHPGHDHGARGRDHPRRHARHPVAALPRAPFSGWRYLAVAAVGGLIAFTFGRHLERLNRLINVLDAAGLSLFAVTGASKALGLGLGPAQAVILGAITGVGGGTLRDVLVRQIPTVLSSGLYAIPALIGATAIVVATELHIYGLTTAVGAAALCFGIRMIGVHYSLDAPMPPAAPDRGADDT